MINFKCIHCNREVELENDIVVYQCVCGFGYDFKKEEDKDDMQTL